MKRDGLCWSKGTQPLDPGRSVNGDGAPPSQQIFPPDVPVTYLALAPGVWDGERVVAGLSISSGPAL